MITRLGSIEHINPKVIESLYAADLASLQDLYNKINHGDEGRQRVSCPQCNHAFEMEAAAVGGF